MSLDSYKAILDDTRAYSDLTGKTGVTGITRYGSDESSELLSPPASTQYGGSILAMPPSALPMDPFSTPRASTGIIVRRCIQSEENISQHPAESKSEKEGMEKTRKSLTPIPRRLELSDDSSNEVMMEVEWRDEELYMTPIKKGKKRNKGKGCIRPVTSEQPIPNMPQTPRRRWLGSDRAKPAESLTNEDEPGNLQVFISEYLRNTNGLRDVVVGQEKYDEQYAKWCGEQVEHVAARQNHTDTAVMSVRKVGMEIKEQVELSWNYDKARAGKLDERLSKIEKKLGKIALVNMAKTIEYALSGCMEKIIDQLTDRVVKRFEDAAEEDRKKGEIQRGKQVEATPEEEMSDIEFEPGATFSREENEKVERAIWAEMEVDRQDLEQSNHAPVILPGGVRGEFLPLEVGQIMILKKKLVVPAVPQHKKKKVKKPQDKGIPTGPKAGGKKPEVKEQIQEKKLGATLDEKKKVTWAQRMAAPLPPKKQP